jgi:ferric-dicitrate binding protein FerR (iron transport regulator)
MIKRIALFLLFPVFALTACAGVALDCPTCGGTMEVPPTAQVAHVSAIYDGTAAFVGTAPAKDGQPIYPGDHFFTGPGTKMEVAIEGGGTILLDANTDPNFFATAQCFWIRLTSGVMTVSNKREMCVDAGGAKVTQHSYVLYAARGGRVTVAVFEGLVTTIEPPGYTVTAGQILYLQNGKPVGPPRQMNQDMINRLQSWIPRVIL